MVVEKNAVSATPRWFGVALQSLVFLASHKKNEARCPSGEIAGHVCTETTLMRRILARLARANIVEAREGRDGGYHLIRTAESITLADVYRAIQMAEPLYAGMLETVPEEPYGHKMRAFYTRMIAESEERLLEVLERYTISDLLKQLDEAE